MDIRDDLPEDDRPENGLTEKDDYLWDGSGEPDPEIQKIEGLLAKFRHDRPTPVFPAVVPERRWTFFRQRTWLFPALAAAAAFVIIGVATFLLYGRRVIPGAAGWDVSSVVGTPRIGSSAINGKAAARLRVGETIETDPRSGVVLQAEAVGRIEVGPNSRLRLLTMGSNLKRIALDRGIIQAYIWSPPGQFVVDTPSAVTVDLGCAYSLQVDDSGAGMLRTSIGWVGFRQNGRESFIPAGAACATKPRVGPGTPYFEDASPDFRAALAKFDFEDNTSQERARDLATVLGESRQRDALTLWHLLMRVEESQRSLVYDRLRKFVPVPAGVSREGILQLDQSMLDQWWNALGFDDVSVWRHWERSWAGEAAPAHEK